MLILLRVGLLVALLVALVIIAVRTARPPRVAIPDTTEHLRLWSTVHAGIDPREHRFVVGWLRLMHTIGRPLARAGVHPDVLTASGLWWALACWTLAAAPGRWSLLAVVALLMGCVADGLDGTVAMLTGRTSRWGGVLDPLADRAADVVLLLALVALGAQPAPAVAAGGGLVALEYLRALAGQQGAALTRVTVGERPTRLILVGVSLWCAGLFPAHAGTIASFGAWSVAAVGLVGFVQLLPAVRRGLR